MLFSIFLLHLFGLLLYIHIRWEGSILIFTLNATLDIATYN